MKEAQYVWDPKPIFKWERINWDKFEELCIHLLKHEISPDVISYGKLKDGGFDAYYQGEYLKEKGMWRFEVKTISFEFGLEQRRKRIKNAIKQHSKNLISKELNFIIYLINVNLTKSDREQLDELFSNQSDIKFRIWELKDIENLLMKYPLLRSRYFFQYQPAFIPSSEYLSSLNDIIYGKPIYGRKNDVKSIIEFLEDSGLLLVVFGNKGIGKSRLGIEISKKISEKKNWNVYHLLSDTESLDQHFSEINFDKNVLIILDDTEHFNNLRTFVRILGNFQEDQKIKILLFCDTASKQKVIYEIIELNLEIKDHELKRLSRKDFTHHLRENFNITDDYLLQMYWNQARGNPGILLYLIDLKKHDLAFPSANLYEKLAKRYTKDFDATQKNILTIIALVEPLPVYDNQLFEKIAELADLNVIRFENLLQQFSEERIVRISLGKIRFNLPILSDIVIWSNIQYETGKISKTWQGIILELLKARPLNVLRNIIKIDYKLQTDFQTSMLHPFLDFIEKVCKDGNILERIDILDYLKVIAFYKPDFTLEMVQNLISKSESLDEESFKSSGISSDIYKKSIIDVLNDIMYHFLYFERFLSLLYPLCLDSAKYVSDKAISLLKSQFEYNTRKPLKYQFKALEWVEKTFNQLSSSKEAEIIFELLCVVLNIEFREIYISPEDLNKAIIKTGKITKSPTIEKLREKSLDTLLNIIRNTDKESYIEKGLTELSSTLHWNYNLSNELGTSDFPTDTEIKMIFSFIDTIKDNTSSLSIVKGINSIVKTISKNSTKWDDPLNELNQIISSNINLNFLKILKDLRFSFHTLSKSEWSVQLKIINSFSEEEFVEFLVKFTKSESYKSLNFILGQFLLNMGEMLPDYSIGAIKLIIEKSKFPDPTLFGYILAGLRISRMEQFNNFIEYLYSLNSPYGIEVVLDSFRARKIHDTNIELLKSNISKIRKEKPEIYQSKIIGVLSLWWKSDPNYCFEILTNMDISQEEVILAIFDLYTRLETWEEEHISFLKILIHQLISIPDLERFASYEIDFIFSKLVPVHLCFTTEFFINRIEFLKENPEEFQRSGYSAIPRFHLYFDKVNSLPNDIQKENIRRVLNYLKNNLSDYSIQIIISQLLQKLVTGSVGVEQPLTDLGKSLLIDFINSLQVKNLWMIPTIMNWYKFDQNLLEVFKHVFMASKGESEVKKSIIASFVTGTSGMHEIMRKKKVLEDYKPGDDEWGIQLRQILIQEVKYDLKREKESLEEES
ncbi:MAG: hypothetical protein ACFFB5_01430 [Promethearchaeota archaeon]